MSVRRIGLGESAQSDLGREKPRRQRVGLLFILSLGTGGIAGLVAFLIIWIPTIYALANAGSGTPQLNAKNVFPPASAIHRTVTVYDPPVYHAPQSQNNPSSQSSPSPSASPSPQPSRSPRPTPSCPPGGCDN